MQINGARVAIGQSASTKDNGTAPSAPLLKTHLDALAKLWHPVVEAHFSVIDRSMFYDAFVTFGSVSSTLGPHELQACIGIARDTSEIRFLVDGRPASIDEVARLVEKYDDPAAYRRRLDHQLKNRCKNHYRNYKAAGLVERIDALHGRPAEPEKAPTLAEVVKTVGEVARVYWQGLTSLLSR